MAKIARAPTLDEGEEPRHRLGDTVDVDGDVDVDEPVDASTVDWRLRMCLSSGTASQSMSNVTTRMLSQRTRLGRLRVAYN